MNFPRSIRPEYHVKCQPNPVLGNALKRTFYAFRIRLQQHCTLLGWQSNEFNVYSDVVGEPIAADLDALEQRIL
ncbi:MAG: hypothetical protein SFW09_14380 [Hyphomicrobiaceae bacterium]|nr:hypothetical protein [Hyphomicrobiaceae bacterium]